MNFQETFSESRRALLAVLAVFCAFYVIEYLTPFHSDDFSYGQMGLGFARHWSHYMGWSGRLVADYSSSFLLMIRRSSLSLPRQPASLSRRFRRN